MEEKIKQLKTALLTDTGNIDVFLGHSIDPYTDLETQIDDVLSQMPDEELETFFKHYNII